MRNNNGKGRHQRGSSGFRMGWSDLIGVPKKKREPEEADTGATTVPVEPPEPPTSPLTPQDASALDSELQNGGTTTGATTGAAPGTDQLEEIPEGFDYSLVPEEERQAQEEFAKEQAEIEDSIWDILFFNLGLYVVPLDSSGKPQDSGCLPLGVFIERLNSREGEHLSAGEAIKAGLNNKALRLSFSWFNRGSQPVRFLSDEASEAVMKDLEQYAKEAKAEIANRLTESAQKFEAAQQKAKAGSQPEASSTPQPAAAPVPMMDPQMLCAMVSALTPEEREGFLVTMFQTNAASMTPDYFRTLMNAVPMSDRKLFTDAFAKSMRLGSTTP